MSLAKITVSQYHIASIIGIYSHERTQQQSLLFDIELIVDITKVSETDKISDTINYEKVTVSLKEFTQQKNYYLVETLASHLVDHLFNTFKPIGIRLCVTKPNALAEAKQISITVQRGRIDL